MKRAMIPLGAALLAACQQMPTSVCPKDWQLRAKGAVLVLSQCREPVFVPGVHPIDTLVESLAFCIASSQKAIELLKNGEEVSR